MLKHKIKFLFTVPFFSLLVSMHGQESAKTTKKEINRFYVGPVDLFFNSLQFAYERDFKNHNSFAAMGSFKLDKEQDVVHRTGGVGEVQYRINLHYDKETVLTFNRSFSSFTYFAPFALYRYEEVRDNTSDQLYTTTYINSVFGGFGFGFRLTSIDNRFTVNFFGGGGMKYSDVYGLKQYSDFFDVGFTGISPRMNIQMGIAF